MKRYGIGLIGYGGFGRFLRDAWSRIENVQMAALSDQDSSRDPADVPFYPDWQDLIRDEQVEVVAIATPPASHATIACAALKEGKHVLVEKPVATDLEAAAGLLDERDRAKRVVTVDFMLRFNPIVETLHEWCRSECFGKLRRVAVENYAQDESLPRDHWFWNQSISGGILVEHGVHFFDVVRWCSGSRPARIDGVAIKRSESQEDRVLATVIHEDGLVATHCHSFSGPDFFERTSMRFVFDLLDLEVRGWIPMAGRVSAILTQDNKQQLARLPGFQLTSIKTAAEVEPRSNSNPIADAGDRTVRTHGVPYNMVSAVAGEFALRQTKAEAYQDALRALMSDFLVAVDDPRHQLRVTLEDGIASLETALAARKDAHGRRT